MAKGKGEDSPAEDYLDQLEWQANHRRRRWPVHFEPKWKYKIVYRFPKTTAFDKVIQSLILLGILSGTGYVIASVISRNQIETPGTIFICFIVTMIVTIIFFAIKDGSDDPKDDE